MRLRIVIASWVAASDQGVAAVCGGALHFWGQSGRLSGGSPDTESLCKTSGTSSMPLRTNLSEAEAAWWDRRGEVLVQGTALMNDKPDAETWTERERRLWLYAVAIGNRIERLQ